MSLVIEMLGNTSASWSVHADSVNFVIESNGTVLVGQITNGLNGSNTSAHRVNTLEGNDLGGVLGDSLELGLKIGHVVVLPDDLLGARVLDTLNHRGVVRGIGKDDTSWKFRSECSETSVIGDVTRGEDQGGLLSV